MIHYEQQFPTRDAAIAAAYASGKHFGLHYSRVTPPFDPAPAGTLVRYCDDFVILLHPKTDRQWILTQVRGMLGRMALELHPQKTRVVEAKDGFDFLGVLAVKRDHMEWLEMSDDEIMHIANPIMDNLMQASTDIDHERHVMDFNEELKSIVTKENLEAQCHKYQKELGFFSKREFVAIFRKSSDVRVFWRQWYSKSKNEFVAFLHLVENDGKVEVVHVSVS